MTRHYCRFPVIAAAVLSLVSGVAVAQDPPPPQKVFQYTTRADAERVYLDFSILKGFYLYRARFGFDSGTDGVAIGAASFPRGETHKDEYFGEQEIYRDKFAIAIPYKRTGAAEVLDLKLRLQGCKDDSICYLPQDWTAAIKLPAAAAGAAARPSLFDGGRGAPASSAGGDLLPVEQAFVMNARFDKPNELTIAWQIAPGYYLYRDKLTAAASGKINLGAVNLPTGRPHKDDNFGDVQIFRDFVEAKVPFARASPDALDVVITAGFQGCKDNSICYPPGEQTMPIVLPATRDFEAATPADGAGDLVAEQDQRAARIDNGS